MPVTIKYLIRFDPLKDCQSQSAPKACQKGARERRNDTSLRHFIICIGRNNAKEITEWGSDALLVSSTTLFCSLYVRFSSVVDWTAGYCGASPLLRTGACIVCECVLSQTFWVRVDATYNLMWTTTRLWGIKVRPGLIRRTVLEESKKRKFGYGCFSQTVMMTVFQWLLTL